MKNMSPKIPIGTPVRITSSPVSYAMYQEGVVTAQLEGGYAVEINTLIPVSGIVPTTKQVLITVWAQEIEPLGEPAAPPLLSIEPS